METFNNFNSIIQTTMKKISIEEVGLYEAPSIEIISTVVERGFSASYGNEGEAGDGFDETDYGVF